MEKNGENVALNENLEQFQKTEKNPRKNHKVRKSRYFSFTTYLNEKQLQTVIAKHSQSIRAFAYILHNKDDTEPHIHFLIRTYSTWSDTQILKWFDFMTMKTNQNTFCEVLNDTYAMYQYLTHTDSVSVAKGKATYSKEEIKDFGLFDIVDQRTSYDETYEIVNNILLGMGERDLIRRYGKNYLYHRNAYHESANEIIYQSSLLRADIKDNIYKETRMLEIDTDLVDIADLMGV